MRTLRWLPLAAALVLLAPAAGWTAGFSLYEQGARALGSAGAYTARVSDPSAVFYNPAGLVGIEGGEFYAGVSGILVGREFAGVSPYPGYGVHETSPTSLFTPFHVYWGQRLGSDLAVGFGVYNPFGLTTEWDHPDDFSGRYVSTKASITPFFFTPTVALRLAPWLRVGAGLTAVHSSLELRRHVGQVNPRTTDPATLDLGRVKLNADNGLDYGGNFGLQVDLTRRMTLGFTYRSKVAIQYDGNADFTFTGTGTELDPQLQGLFPKDQGVSTNIDFPASFVAALAVSPSDRLTLEGDLGWTQWSSFQSLPIRFDDASLSQTLVENWDDAFFFRAGAEWALRPDLNLRFGYYYDQTPQPTESISPLLPDNDRHGLSVGIGKDWGRFRADAFALLLLIGDRDTEGVNRDGYEGTYSNGVQIAGVSLGYRY